MRASEMFAVSRGQIPVKCVRRRNVEAKKCCFLLGECAVQMAVIWLVQLCGPGDVALFRASVQLGWRLWPCADRVKRFIFLFGVPKATSTVLVQ